MFIEDTLCNQIIFISSTSLIIHHTKVIQMKDLNENDKIFYLTYQITGQWVTFKQINHSLAVRVFKCYQYSGWLFAETESKCRQYIFIMLYQWN